MTVYTFSEARQRLAAVLEEAELGGAVRIKRRDGSECEISPIHRQGSPLDVQGVDLDFSTGEIVEVVREMRQRD